VTVDYIMIRAWGELIGSEQHFVRDQIAIAHEDKAPGNAIFKRDDGTWATVEDIASSNRRQQVERIAARIQAKDNPTTRTII
jgi:hypothetical protein